MEKNEIIKKARLCKLLKNGNGIDRLYIEQKLGISKTTFHRYISELRDIGAEISYNKTFDTYRLVNEFDILEYCKRELV